ncbi:sugar transporter [Octadecabacter sp. G9-8]|uniref:Sugar transporter n=1 Tax=Octadecabacter dasysiphoniae TaxID=2909341 RepID=A0ABS9CUP7_9RHOB|nr:sugar transporter [Octadecabacter dasysiphoniae]MCF2870957.1 sugar transporter [Octadecabacter dasysiphoniae]
MNTPHPKPVIVHTTQGPPAPKKPRGNLSAQEREARKKARHAKQKPQKQAQPKPKSAQTGAPKQKKIKPAARIIEVPPMASPARLRRRHWGMIFSLVCHVCIPLLIAGWYIWDRAEDRYASTVGFTVQQEQAPSLASPLTDAFSALGGAGGSMDADILYEYLHSQQLVEAIDAQFDLRGHYGQFHATDPIFALAPDATLEDMVDYWPRILKISYDENSGLIELQTLAYTPEIAQNIAHAVLSNSQALINDLNAQSRQDTMRYAQEDLTNAQTLLSEARGALVAFRTRTQIVDPATDLAGRLGIVNTLQQQLAEALVDYDLLSQSTGERDPRIVQAQGRIDVIRTRLTQERANVARGQDSETGEDYPTLLAQYEELIVRREIAEQSFRVALSSMEAARADAARQSRYLAAYITPTLPQSASYPDRMMLLALIALFTLLTWTIGVLIYYSVRDNR